MLRNMEYVYAVYQKMSFSKAAEMLYISQPALSTIIKKVETDIHHPIFDRSSNPIGLTLAGEYYIQSIEKIMAIEKDMTAYFEELTDTSCLTLNIGGAAFFCAHILPTLLERFAEQYHGCRTSILEVNSGDLEKCLQSGVLDIGLSVDTLDSNAFTSIVWNEERIIMAVPSSFPINERLKDYRLTFDDMRRGVYQEPDCPKVDLAWFRDQPFILLKKGNDMYRRTMKMFRNAGFPPKVSLYLDQLLTSYYVAADGKGIVFIRAALTLYTETTQKLYFYKIDDENSIRKVMLYYKKTAALSRAAKDFIEFLKVNP